MEDKDSQILSGHLQGRDLELAIEARKMLYEVIRLPYKVIMRTANAKEEDDG